MSHARGNARTALRTAAGAAAAGALLTGCGTGYSGGTDWDAPPRYSYTLKTRTMALSGTFRVHVAGGEVVRAKVLDGGSMPPGRLIDRVHSVEELLERVANARDEDAYRAEVRFDGEHRPVRIELDQDENAADDEASYTMHDYRTG